MTTTRELIRIVKAHTGPIFVPVMVREDVRYLRITKAEILLNLSEYQQDDEEACPWWTVTKDRGDLILDV